MTTNVRRAVWFNTLPLGSSTALAETWLSKAASIFAPWALNRRSDTASRLVAKTVPAERSGTPTSDGLTDRPHDLSAFDWGSIRSAHERHRHSAVASANGQVLPNPGQQWRTHIDETGFVVQPDNGGWSWGLGLKSYGFRGHEVALALPPRVTTNGPRVSYEHDETLQEWLVNDHRGLEHGFTVRQRPASGGRGSETPASVGARPARFTFTLAVRGSLHPEAQPDGQSVHFKSDEGGAVLTYAGLKVWDADGTILPACFEPVTSGERTLRLTVDEQDARYPLTIDPIIQQAYLKASNTATDQQFGWSVAVSGDTAIIGAPHESSNAKHAGAAYVFVRSGGMWSQQAYLQASNTEANDLFGWSVALSGDVAVVGAPEEKSVTGSPSNNGGNAVGAAYVFERVNGVWSERAYLKASTLVSSDRFGWSVAAAGETVVVGAPEKQVSGNLGVIVGAGVAYVFVRSGNAWPLQADLVASNPNSNSDARFGTSVAVEGNTVVVGAARQLEGGSRTGAAYVFVRTGPAWSQQAILKASNGDQGDAFGWSVAVADYRVVVGAPKEDSSATGVNLASSNNPAGQNDNSAADAGAAYLFVRTGNAWSQWAYLKASNTGAGEGFGHSVAVGGNIVVVGAPFESSYATGVNGDQTNNSAAQSGAVYIFGENRFRTTFTQHTYLKASNTGPYDMFGAAIAVSGATLVAGAFNEDSNALGVNGNQSNDTAPASGAAYVFDLEYRRPLLIWWGGAAVLLLLGWRLLKSARRRRERAPG